MIAKKLDRRDWMRFAAGAAVLGGAKGFAAGGFRHAIGVQLYTVRSVIKGHEDDVLRQIAEIGYTEVETTGQTPLDAIDPMLRKYKLKPVSMHLDANMILGEPEKMKAGLAASIDTAKKYGVEYLVFPYLPPAARGDADTYRKLADKLNQAGEQVHASGLEFCYHNHAFEFGGAAGERAIDIFKQRLDKKLVNLELDVFWVSVSGNNPVELLKEFAGRVPLLHLKDKLQGAPVMYNESVPKETFKEVGSGSIDIAAVLKAAQSTGVKHYFVEQDQTPGNPVDSLRKSYQFLRSV